MATNRRLEEKVALIPGATKDIGKAEDVARGGAVYLAADGSRSVTRTALPTDGGLLACPA